MRSRAFLSLFLVAVVLGCVAHGVEACMRGGISTRATVALIGLCVIFSPVILVGAAGYGAVRGGAAAVEAIQEKVHTEREKRKLRAKGSNLFLQQRNRLVK